MNTVDKYIRNYRKNELKIRRIEAASGQLTGRAGLALFEAYLQNIEIFKSKPVKRTWPLPIRSS
ncbi:MAG: hypothetical protein CR984_02905 [Proteobacteria bacterium]|nr:MAG: hypothetical protein CR984_02905 [Pseudomonadota bacterium]PIE68082.1 MAG: hypothetical protein CSA23_00815 [Deltaproteobacteria bacterium]